MTKSTKLKLAKVLIAFAFVLVFIGIGIDLDKKVLINPITDTHVIGKTKNDDISITTSDTKTPPANLNEQPNNNQNANNRPGETNNQNSGKNHNHTSENKGHNPPPDFQQSTTQLTGMEETNNNLRNNIQNKYGITVKYGAETNGYTIAGLSSVMLSDANRINEVLSSLNYNLSLYPSDLFNETKQENYSLTIYLLKRYSQNNVTGITDSTTRNVVISLATDISFTDSLHHELYHYIEKYMFTKGANYTTWNSLNPQDFSYGKQNTALSYDNTNNPYATFVNIYAQTDEYEDRASTFEYLMTDSEESCLQTGTPVWKKAKYMCEQIDAVFQTVSPSITEYWERYVYN